MVMLGPLLLAVTVPLMLLALPVLLLGGVAWAAVPRAGVVAPFLLFYWS